MAQVNAQDRIWHNVYRAWLKRLARSIRILKENGVYLTRDADYAYQVAQNVEGAVVKEQRSGICRVAYTIPAGCQLDRYNKIGKNS